MVVVSSNKHKKVNRIINGWNKDVCQRNEVVGHLNRLVPAKGGQAFVAVTTQVGILQAIRLVQVFALSMQTVLF
jgi:hypothetical protein